MLTRSEKFRQNIRRYPPIHFRLLARHKNGPALTSDEISRGGDLALYSVEWLSWQTSWDAESMGRFFQFSEGCMIDLLDRACMKRIENYLAGTDIGDTRRPVPYRYLKRSPVFKSYYLPLIEHYRKSQSNDN